MAIIKDGRMPCRITDGVQYDNGWVDDDGWVDNIRDMEAFEFLELVSEHILPYDISDWFIDAVIDELHANDHGAFKELLESVLDLPPTRRTTLRRVFEHLSGELLHKAFENAAKKMKKNETILENLHE